MYENISLNVSSISFDNSFYKRDYSQTIIYESSYYLMPIQAVICSFISLPVMTILISMKNRQNFHKLMIYEVVMNLILIMSYVKFDPYYTCNYCTERGDSYVNTAYQLYVPPFAYNCISHVKFIFGKFNK